MGTGATNMSKDHKTTYGYRSIMRVYGHWLYLRKTSNAVKGYWTTSHGLGAVNLQDKSVHFTIIQA